MSSDRSLKDFEGVWHLCKTIEAQNSAPAHFDGEARWSRDAQGLLYAEQGLLTLPGQAPLHAERRYLWTPELNVFFEDGRFFHTVPSAGGRAEHACPPDHYVVKYVFATWPEFRATWRVSGPRKSYVMTAHYARIEP